MSDGAEQRIFSIYRYLKNGGCECAVFYLGTISKNDQTLIDDHALNVFVCTSDQPPEKLKNRLRWYADATINQARSWLSREQQDLAVVDGPPSLTLTDFVWPWAKTRFAEIVESYKPDTIIFEYIKMSYLMDGLSREERKRACCLVDTHDVLHRRAEQFFQNGFPHWLRIDRNEEANVLKKFDAIIAIQEKEAATFREMTESKIDTLTVGHAVEGDVDFTELTPQASAPDKITVGYIGSKNFSNWQAIREFLNCAWPAVVKKNKGRCELVIAGAICDWLESNSESDNPVGTGNNEGQFCEGAFEDVKLLGRIDGIKQFYDQIDVVINPVEFGTGLKIKNAESLRFGKLLITTLNGFDGMPEATRLACKVVEDVNEMGLAINSICGDLSSIRPMQQLALQLAQTEFSEQQAYSELKQYLNRRDQT